MKPINIEQQALIQEVATILQESNIQLSDNFIELGGNSFLAIQVAISLREKENLAINIAQLLGDRLENVTIQPIVKMLEKSA